MPRYIDMAEAKIAIKDLFPDMPRIDFMDNRSRWRKVNEQYLRCLDVLDSLPTVDAVPVVRCKECAVQTICRYKTGLGDNGFCSQGERREDVGKSNNNDN